jgi:hypothetical protein
MLDKVNAREAKFRSETLNFVADPRIFSEVCEVICDTVYDLLYNDGFQLAKRLARKDDGRGLSSIFANGGACPLLPLGAGNGTVGICLCGGTVSMEQSAKLSCGKVGE